MNYQKIYDQIIQKAISEKRNKGKGVYYENHHIIPLCMNGSNLKENLVLLTAREHFIAHKLLVRIYPNNISLNYAVWLINNSNLSKDCKIKLSSREYSKLKEILSINHSILLKGKNKGEDNPMFGKVSPFKGRVHSEDAKNMIRLMRTGSKASEETKKHLSSIRKGDKHRMFGKHQSEETKNKISNSLVGNKDSLETRNKKSISRMGDKNPMFGKKQKQLTCPHCNKSGGTTMVRWHFDKCKFK